jgi:hypothetical protein
VCVRKRGKKIKEKNGMRGGKIMWHEMELGEGLS